MAIRLEKTEKHSRCLLAKGLKAEHRSDYPELEIQINYTAEGNACKGVALDGQIVPAIIAAVNGRDALIQRNGQLLSMLEEALSIGEQFKKKMSDDELRQWCKLSATTADIRLLADLGLHGDESSEDEQAALDHG